VKGFKLMFRMSKNFRHFALTNLLLRIKVTISCGLDFDVMTSSCCSTPLSNAIVATMGAPCSGHRQHENFIMNWGKTHHQMTKNIQV
jgi:hypothetical protein